MLNEIHLCVRVGGVLWMLSRVSCKHNCKDDYIYNHVYIYMVFQQNYEVQTYYF